MEWIMNCLPGVIFSCIIYPSRAIAIFSCDCSHRQTFLVQSLGEPLALWWCLATAFS